LWATYFVRDGSFFGAGDRGGAMMLAQLFVEPSRIMLEVCGAIEAVDIVEGTTEAPLMSSDGFENSKVSEIS
jgi:hypothetical protein